MDMHIGIYQKNKLRNNTKIISTAIKQISSVLKYLDEEI